MDPQSAIELSSSYYLRTNPNVDPRRLPILTPDMLRFMQNVMRAERLMSIASTRSPEQDLLITYLQNKDKQRMLVDQGGETQKRKSPTQEGSPRAKQKSSVKQDLVPFHEQQIATASASGAASSSEAPRGRGRPRSKSVLAEERRQHQQFKELTAELQGVKTKAKVQ